MFSLSASTCKPPGAAYPKLGTAADGYERDRNGSVPIGARHRRDLRPELDGPSSVTGASVQGEAGVRRRARVGGGSATRMEMEMADQDEAAISGQFFFARPAPSVLCSVPSRLLLRDRLRANGVRTEKYCVYQALRAPRLRAQSSNTWHAPSAAVDDGDRARPRWPAAGSTSTTSTISTGTSTPEQQSSYAERDLQYACMHTNIHTYSCCRYGEGPLIRSCPQ